MLLYAKTGELTDWQERWAGAGGIKEAMKLCLVIMEVVEDRADKDKENALSTDSCLRSELPCPVSLMTGVLSALLTTLQSEIIETDGNKDFHVS